MSIADPNKTILTGENPFVRLSPRDGEPNSTEASYWRIIFSPGGPGHVLLEKRADGTALAHLLRQHRDGAVAAVDRTRYAQCRTFRHNDPLCGRAILQSWGSTLLLDRAHQVARRRNLTYLVRYRRAATDPLAAEPDSRPALRRVHRADPGARHPSRPQRRRGEGAILAAGT